MESYEAIEHLGKRYTRRSGKWVDSTYMIVCESMQATLNKLYAQSIDIQTTSVASLISEADKFKHCGTFDTAIMFYEKAASTATQSELAFILPRLTSCYRSINRPEKAIWLLTFAKHKYGEVMVTPTLLTSAAAAYCDLSEYGKALACCKRAQRKMQGSVTSELKLVYKRIRAATKNGN